MAPERPQAEPKKREFRSRGIWRPSKIVSRWLALGTSVRKKQGPSHRVGQQGSKDPWERFRFSRSHRPTFKFWPWCWPILWLGINYFIFMGLSFFTYLAGQSLGLVGGTCHIHIQCLLAFWRLLNFSRDRRYISRYAWNELTVVNPVSRVPWIPCLPK